MIFTEGEMTSIEEQNDSYREERPFNEKETTFIKDYYRFFAWISRLFAIFSYFCRKITNV